jgi:hypothetical protein
MYDGSTSKAIATFKAALDRARLSATVRLTRGVTFKPRAASSPRCRGDALSGLCVMI